MIDHKKNRIVKILSTTACLSALLLTSCASTNGSIVSTDDPYEEINRTVFYFNEGLDNYVGEPVSSAYDFITPDLVQSGIGNFFNNLKDINVILNDLMQAKLLQAGEDTGRFLLNSTVGLAGILDVASEVGLNKNNEDFAQTLGVWGVPKGPYLVLPIIGPSTSRGVPGLVFDAAVNPATYIPIPIRSLEMLNMRANAEGTLKVIDEGALDPYLFTRESFLQSRQHLVTDGNSELENDLDIDALIDETNLPIESPEMKKASDTLNTTGHSLDQTGSRFDESSKKIDQINFKKLKIRRR
ncbi:MAG: VacJ family lipoprotein [Methylococcales bacterium]|nr:VacJ family lipoprotein [Methylococcales bacterium]